MIDLSSAYLILKQRHASRAEYPGRFCIPPEVFLAQQKFVDGLSLLTKLYEVVFHFDPRYFSPFTVSLPTERSVMTPDIIVFAPTWRLISWRVIRYDTQLPSLGR